MPKTPELGQLNTSSSSRFSPYNKSINKNLLTPCRQIGLSRKRKTPNKINLPVSPQFAAINKVGEPTKKVSLAKENESPNIQSNINKISKVEKLKPPKNESTPIKNKEVPVIHCKTFKTITSNATSIIKVEDSALAAKLLKKSTIDKANVRSEKADNLIKQKIPENQAIKIVINKVEVKSDNNKKVAKRSLSMKKSLDEDAKKIKTKHCSVQLDKFKDLDINDLQNKIEELEKTKIDKLEQLNKLQQAEVYQKMHNTEDLKKLTEKWTNGCKEALSDLLIHLQSHSHIDKSTLLSNLNIPTSLTSLLT